MLMENIYFIPNQTKVYSAAVINFNWFNGSNWGYESIQMFIVIDGRHRVGGRL